VEGTPLVLRDEPQGLGERTLSDLPPGMSPWSVKEKPIAATINRRDATPRSFVITIRPVDIQATPLKSRVDRHSGKYVTCSDLVLRASSTSDAPAWQTHTRNGQTYASSRSLLLLINSSMRTREVDQLNHPGTSAAHVFLTWRRPVYPRSGK
jgi:hypothetical protein